MARTLAVLSTLIASCVAAIVLPLYLPLSKASAAAPPPRLAVSALKVMTYFPSTGGWGQMWTNYSHQQVDSDMQSIRSLGANTVRLIVNPYSIGWPTINGQGQKNLNDLIQTAESNGLNIQLSLFDQWGLYSDTSDSSSWLAQGFSKYRNDPHFVLIELQNEIVSSNPAAMAWARAELAFLPAVFPGVPRTLSVRSQPSPANFQALINQIPAPLLDVVDVHLYQSLDSNYAALAAAKALAGGRPVIVGESGRSSGPASTPATEFAQAKYYQDTLELCRQFRIAYFTPWILSDFVAGGTLPGMPAAESSFGLRRLDGTWKPAASVVRTMFAASPSVRQPATGLLTSAQTDGNFETDASTATSSGLLGFWSLNDRADMGQAGVAANAGVRSSRAAFLSKTKGRPTNYPALYEQFPLTSDRDITIGSSVRVSGATGITRVAIAWFANDRYIGGAESKNATNKTTQWQTLRVGASAPAGATSFRVYLKSAYNSGTAYFDNVWVRQSTH